MAVIPWVHFCRLFTNETVSCNLQSWLFQSVANIDFSTPSGNRQFPPYIGVAIGFELTSYTVSEGRTVEVCMQSGILERDAIVSVSSFDDTATGM